MGKEPEKILNEFKERLSSFIGLKIELFKLNALRKGREDYRDPFAQPYPDVTGSFCRTVSFLYPGFFPGGGAKQYLIRIPDSSRNLHSPVHYRLLQQKEHSDRYYEYRNRCYTRERRRR